MKSSELSEAKISTPKSGMTRGLSIMDFILRLTALAGTIGSSISMGTTKESLPFFTQFVRFRAEYTDLPTFSFFVVANAIASIYLVLSLPLSCFHIIRSTVDEILPCILLQVMLSLLTSGASAAAAIVYLAHNGNAKANWFSFCQQFNSFCERISGSLIGSFLAISLLVLMILLSAAALSRR